MEWRAGKGDLSIGPDFANDYDIDGTRESGRVDTRIYQSEDETLQGQRLSSQ